MAVNIVFHCNPDSADMLSIVTAASALTAPNEIQVLTRVMERIGRAAGEECPLADVRLHIKSRLLLCLKKN